MLVVTVVTLIGLVVVVAALYREEPLSPLEPGRPDWQPLPDPGEVQRSSFPLAFPGYDPVAVEGHLEALTAAYTDLWACATPEVLARARLRAATRLDVAPPEARAPAPFVGPATSLNGGEHGDAEALRTEAALARLAAAKPERGRPLHSA